MYTQLLKERDSIAGAPIYPISNNGTQNTGAVDMSKFNRVNFDVMVGTLGANASVQAYLGETTNSTGNNATNITGGAITNISTASCMATLEMSAVNMTKRYAVCTLVVSTNATIVSCMPRGTEGRYPPVNNNDVASVAQRLAI